MHSPWLKVGLGAPACRWTLLLFLSRSILQLYVLRFPFSCLLHVGNVFPKPLVRDRSRDPWEGCHCQDGSFTSIPKTETTQSCFHLNSMFCSSQSELESSFCFLFSGDLFISWLPVLDTYSIAPIWTQHFWENCMKLNQENKIYLLSPSLSCHMPHLLSVFVSRGCSLDFLSVVFWVKNHKTGVQEI